MEVRDTNVLRVLMPLKVKSLFRVKEMKRGFAKKGVWEGWLGQKVLLLDQIRTLDCPGFDIGGFIFFNTHINPNKIWFLQTRKSGIAISCFCRYSLVLYQNFFAIALSKITKF